MLELWNPNKISTQNWMKSLTENNIEMYKNKTDIVSPIGKKELEFYLRKAKFYFSSVYTEFWGKITPGSTHWQTNWRKLKYYLWVFREITDQFEDFVMVQDLRRSS